MTSSLNSYVAFAEELADASGKILQKYYRAVEGVEVKSDQTIVTLADKETEQALREMIVKRYPNHGIRGEEFGIEREDAEYQWVLDPIDGTTSFLIGRPLFGTLISLVHKESPLIGIINQPITKERWVGVKEVSARLNESIIHTGCPMALSDVILCTTSHSLLRPDIAEKFETLTKKVKCTSYGGDCYNYGLLAAGHVDVIIETGLKAHDFCALVPIVEAAGGVITDFENKALTLHSTGNVVAASSKKIHQLVIEEMFGRKR